jgi:flagellin
MNLGIRINQNIASLLAQQALTRSTDRLTRLYEQLSSGDRINSAGDDISGLSMSQSLRTQVQSMDRAVRVSNDGLSVIDTAEAALSNIENTIQRIREISVQAANDTLSDENRNSIQLEIEQLVEEIDRLATNVDFSGKRLLDGSFFNQRVQLGVNAMDFLSVTIPDMHTDNIGLRAIVTGLFPVSSDPLSSEDVFINGIEISVSQSDGISFVADDASAIAKAEAINRHMSQTGVTATAEAAVHQALGAQIQPISLNGTTSALHINGINIGPVDVSAADSTGALRAAINTHSEVTGVVATLGDSGELVLTAEDGRNFQVTTTGSVADELGLATANSDLTAEVVTGHITLSGPDTITVSGADIRQIGFAALQEVTQPDPSTALENIRVTTQEDAEEAIATSDAAIRQLNNLRTRLGALANRIESSSQAAEVHRDNLRAADSRIRDTDFAVATADATREQIIQQAATAVLSQANLLPQLALQLFDRSA